MPLYNDALARFGSDDFVSAEAKFRRLLDSDYFRLCGWESAKPRPVATNLQYNSFKYVVLVV